MLLILLSGATGFAYTSVHVDGGKSHVDYLHFGTGARYSTQFVLLYTVCLEMQEYATRQIV